MPIIKNQQIQIKIDNQVKKIYIDSELKRKWANFK